MQPQSHHNYLPPRWTTFIVSLSLLINTIEHYSDPWILIVTEMSKECKRNVMNAMGEEGKSITFCYAVCCGETAGEPG
jgi:hypothetical protein